jgi:hypothetical protein
MSKSLDPTAEASVEAEGEMEKGNVSKTHVPQGPHPPSYRTL